MASSEEKPKDFVETIEVSEEIKKPLEKSENHLTLSTQLSTEQLICKSPRGSSNSSSGSSVKTITQEKLKEVAPKKCSSVNVVLYTGLLQILFGFLMLAFGVLVILHDASLSQIAGGIWGGCLAMATGIVGILASAKSLCPLKDTAQKIAHTVYLALSLISLAISQLVLVLAATGLARDVNKQDTLENVIENTSASSEDSAIYLPENYLTLLSNLGLVIVSAIECVCAAISSYQGARAICPCFRSSEDGYQYAGNINSSHAIVSSWLGKHSPPPHLYVVAAPSSIGKHSKLSSGLPMTPVFAMQPQMMPPQSVIPYPLIPAPLGPIPSPIIAPHRKEMVHPRCHRRYSMKDAASVHANYCQKKKSKSRSKSKEKEPVLTNEDVARTYTGLDRVIAEEFIEICDSRNNSMCTDSCPSVCQCQGGCTACSTTCSTSDLTSNNFK